MDNVDRFFFGLVLIGLVLMLNSVWLRQNTIQKDIAEIKQTVERIELNTAVLDTIVVPLPDSMQWYHIEVKLIHKEVNNGSKE